MKLPIKTLGPVLFGLAAALSLFAMPRASAIPEDRWRTDLEAATLEARETGKPILAAFR